MRDLIRPWSPSVWIDYLVHCTWELVIARYLDLCVGADFNYFLWEIVQEKARTC